MRINSRAIPSTISSPILHSVSIGSVKQLMSRKNINWAMQVGLALAYQRGEISYDEFDRGAKALESVNTNWFDVLYQTPFSHSHSLSFSGGNENSTYYASLGYSSNQNTAKGNSQTSYTGRLNLSSTFWNKLRLNVSLSGSHTETKAFANGVDPFNYAINANRAIACYEEDGSLFYCIRK